MKHFRIIPDHEVKEKVDMHTAIELMRDAFVQISSRSAMVPVRSAINTQDQKGRVLFMPAYSSDYNLFGVKTVSVFPDNARKGMPSIQGKILIMDDITGTPQALIDAEYLTALRTGAASGLATDLLANPAAKVLALFGTGAQAKTQVNAILEVRKISEVMVYGSTMDKSDQFCKNIENEHQVKCIVGDIENLKEADVICSATTSINPLFKLTQIKPGVHINGIGSYKQSMREMPSEVIKKSLLVVDHRESALSEAGDIIIPIEKGAIDSSHIHAELGEIVTGAKKGRTDEKQITVFKSVGNAVQDLAIAKYLLRLS